MIFIEGFLLGSIAFVIGIWFGYSVGVLPLDYKGYLDDLPDDDVPTNKDTK